MTDVNIAVKHKIYIVIDTFTGDIKGEFLSRLDALRYKGSITGYRYSHLTVRLK